jgi:hypothetical protein
MGVDVRLPLGGPTFWLQGGFMRSEGKTGQDNVALQIPIGFGFSE